MKVNTNTSNITQLSHIKKLKSRLLKVSELTQRSLSLVTPLSGLYKYPITIAALGFHTGLPLRYFTPRDYTSTLSKKAKAKAKKLYNLGIYVCHTHTHDHSGPRQNNN